MSGVLSPYYLGLLFTYIMKLFQIATGVHISFCYLTWYLSLVFLPRWQIS